MLDMLLAQASKEEVLTLMRGIEQDNPGFIKDVLLALRTLEEEDRPELPLASSL